jgi:hypothetical protein
MDGFVNAAGTTAINLQRQHTVRGVLELEADVGYGVAWRARVETLQRGLE